MSDAANNKITLTTTLGTLSFPHIFEDTKTKNDKGEDVYDIQIIIPKTDRAGLQAIAKAIKEVGQSKWGANYNKVKNPLRDGDKEKDKIADDGQTYGEKYPERLGCYFLNARSRKPVGVFDRTRTPIVNSNDVYGGCKGKINVTFYAYATNGNSGVAAGLNGVQKISDGESFGNGRPNVESMFDILDEEADAGLDDGGLDGGLDDGLAEEPEPTPPPATKKTAASPAAKKAAAARKAAEKAAAAAAAAEADDDGLDDMLGGDDDADAGYDDLDSLADDDS